MPKLLGRMVENLIVECFRDVEVLLQDSYERMKNTSTKITTQVVVVHRKGSVKGNRKPQVCGVATVKAHTWWQAVLQRSR